MEGRGLGADPSLFPRDPPGSPSPVAGHRCAEGEGRNLDSLSPPNPPKAGQPPPCQDCDPGQAAEDMEKTPPQLPAPAWGCTPGSHCLSTSGVPGVALDGGREQGFRTRRPGWDATGMGTVPPWHAAQPLVASVSLYKTKALLKLKGPFNSWWEATHDGHAGPQQAAQHGHAPPPRSTAPRSAQAPLS